MQNDFLYFWTFCGLTFFVMAYCVVFVSDEVQSVLSFCAFLAKITCGSGTNWLSIEELRSKKFRKVDSSDEIRRYLSRLEIELEAQLREDPAMKSSPFKAQVSKLVAKYESLLNEKLGSSLTASDAEEFLELMLTDVKPEEVEGFVKKSCNAIRHRFSDAATTLGISSSVLGLYWKLLLKPQLITHLNPGGYRTRLASILIRWKVSDVDKLDLEALMKYFPDRDSDVIKKALEKFGRNKPLADEPLFRVLLRDDKFRLLHIFDQIREYFVI